MDTRSEAELLVAVRTGDTTATAALLERHAPAVLRFARALCANPIDAEDVAQEALIAAARALPGVQADAALTSWFYAITRSFCRRSHRRRKGQPAVMHPLDASNEPAELEGATGPEGVASGRELAAALQLAMRGLDPKMREVVLLRDVEGLSAPEVAAALNLELATVKTRLHRGRAAIRARIGPLLTPGPQRQASCPEVVGLFSRYLEGDVGPAECELMHAHVDTCPSCNAACAALRRTVALCRDAGAQTPPDVQTRVREALRVVVGAR